MKFPNDMPDPERLKLAAALEIVGKQNEWTDKSRKITTPVEDRITWRQWWERKFKDDYGRFTRQYFEYFKPERKNANS